MAPFADVRELGQLLQRAGFALPVVDSDRLTVRYSTALALMHDLRRMGATNVLQERRRTPLKRATLARTAEIYAQRFADADGRLRALRLNHPTTNKAVSHATPAAYQM